jgi:hypothetical protein
MEKIKVIAIFLFILVGAIFVDAETWRSKEVRV